MVTVAHVQHILELGVTGLVILITEALLLSVCVFALTVVGELLLLLWQRTCYWGGVVVGLGLRYPRRLILPCLLVFGVSSLAAQRPSYDSRIEGRYGSLLDSLVAIMGTSPAHIRILPALDMAGAAGQTVGGDIALARVDDHTLLHELGHFWSGKTNVVALAAADSLRIDPMSRRGADRLAEAYAEILRVRGDVTHTTNGDAILVSRLLTYAGAQPRRGLSLPSAHQM